MGDRERGLRQLYEFRKQVWGGMYYQSAGKIQNLGPYVRQDVLARLNSSCGIFREELGCRLNWIKGVQGNMLQGGAKSCKFGRYPGNPERPEESNARRSNGGFFTALRNFTVEIEKNTHDNQQMNRKFVAIQQQMEGMGKEAQVEFGKSINSVALRFDSRSGGKSTDQATSLNEWVKSEGVRNTSMS